MKRNEIYVSVDIEADGPIPVQNSMLSFGAAAFKEDGTQVATFTRNLEILEGSAPHPSTQAFWERNMAAYEATRKNCVHPKEAMQEFAHWAKGLPSRPVMVGFPVTYDFMFLHYGLMRFLDESPFSHSGIDIKTMAMIALGCDYHSASKRNWPRRWFPPKSTHTHVALDDAIEQGIEFCNILAELRGHIPKKSQ